MPIPLFLRKCKQCNTLTHSLTHCHKGATEGKKNQHSISRINRKISLTLGNILKYGISNAGHPALD